MVCEPKSGPKQAKRTTWRLTCTLKRRLQRDKVVKKMKQTLTMMVDLKVKSQG